VATAARLDLENVEFRAAVPSPEVPSLLSSADVLAITWLDRPLYNFGISPNKLFDYFAAGRPVLMALNSPHDPVSDADAGMTVPAEDPQAFAEAVLQLRAAGRDERIRMGLNGRRSVEDHYDIAELGKKFTSVLNSVGPVSRTTGSQPQARKGSGRG
jgi:glycosyltransferase involved in cell wall biosynthesis